MSDALRERRDQTPRWGSRLPHHASGIDRAVGSGHHPPQPHPLIRTALVPVLLLGLLVSCSETYTEVSEGRRGSAAAASPPTRPEQTETTAKESAKERRPDYETVVVRIRLVRRTDDPATDEFFEVAERTLEDQRGWQRAGFDIRVVRAAKFRVVLAEGPVVDRLCHPYTTRSTYSCQNGPVVALNADRWRMATPQWTGSLPGYRRMLVNHEVGHLLGQHHPHVQCPQPGHDAPIMAQQSTELNGCLPNPWPLPHEIKRAAKHDLPLAPPFED